MTKPQSLGLALTGTLDRFKQASRDCALTTVPHCPRPSERSDQLQMSTAGESEPAIHQHLP